MQDVTFKKKYVNLRQTHCPVCGNKTQVNIDYEKQICVNCKRKFSIKTKRIGKSTVIEPYEQDNE